MFIGFCGKKGAGKDTAAEFFRDCKTCEILSFAGPLKEASKHLFGLSDFQVNVQKETVDEVLNKTPRKILQDLGTLLRNNYGEDVLIRALNARVEKLNSKYFIITDVRFENECEYIKNNGGFIIRIERPDLVNTDDHESENRTIDKYVDKKIINNGTIQNLHNEVKNSMLDFLI